MGASLSASVTMRTLHLKSEDAHGLFSAGGGCVTARALCRYLPCVKRGGIYFTCSMMALSLFIEKIGKFALTAVTLIHSDWCTVNTENRRAPRWPPGALRERGVGGLFYCMQRKAPVTAINVTSLVSLSNMFDYLI